MKKRIALFVLFVCVFMNACGPGSNDWEYELMNGWSIQHINSKKIVCSNNNSVNYYSSNYVVRFCYNDRYICLQCVNVPEDSSEEIDKSNPYFYVIDTETSIVLEKPPALTKEEYLDKIKSLGINNLTEWKETVPAPKGSVYVDGTVKK